MPKNRLVIILVCVVVAVAAVVYFWPKWTARGYLVNSVSEHELFEFGCVQDNDCRILNSDLKLDCRDYDCGVSDGCLDSNDSNNLSVNFEKYSLKLKEACDTPERRAEKEKDQMKFACDLGLSYCPDTDTTYRAACREGKCVKVKK